VSTACLSSSCNSTLEPISFSSSIAESLRFKSSTFLIYLGVSMRDSGLVIEIELPLLTEQGDEEYITKRVMLFFNGATPYAMYNDNGRVILHQIDRELLRYGVTVVGGPQYDNALEATLEYT